MNKDDFFIVTGDPRKQSTGDAAILKHSLGELPEPVAMPVLVMISGLPGSGKTHLSRRLVERMPAVILESDALRKALFSNPDYTAQESKRLFSAIHQLIFKLLKTGIPVVLDATNLEESNRLQIYHIAEQAESKLILVETRAPEELIRQRLEARALSLSEESMSDAGWEVYKRMRLTSEKIKRQHFVADTSRDITPVINKILREIRRG